jgi:hypothetical protein
MADLERALGELAAELEHPPTPDLAAAVRQRLRERPRRRTPLRTRRIAIALGLALVLPAGAVAAVAPVRDALLDALGLGVRIERTPSELPPAPVGSYSDLGRRIDPARASGAVHFDAVGAPSLGTPAAAYVRSFPPGGALSYVYSGGLLLTQLRGSAGTLYAGKLAGPETTVERAEVGGAPAVWLGGHPHAFLYVDARGRTQTETLRRAANTLLWQRGPLTLRLEGAPSKAAALRIARSVR